MSVGAETKHQSSHHLTLTNNAHLNPCTSGHVVSQECTTSPFERTMATPPFVTVCLLIATLWLPQPLPAVAEASLLLDTAPRLELLAGRPQHAPLVSPKLLHAVVAKWSGAQLCNFIHTTQASSSTCCSSSSTSSVPAAAAPWSSPSNASLAALSPSAFVELVQQWNNAMGAPRFVTSPAGRWAANLSQRDTTLLLSACQRVHRGHVQWDMLPPMAHSRSPLWLVQDLHPLTFDVGLLILPVSCVAQQAALSLSLYRQ